VANRKTHVSAGIVCGAAAALYMAREQQGGAFVGEVLGGSLGGFVGALLPDKFEPPIHSWHRSTAHSVAAAGAIASTAMQSVAAWQQLCRNKAVHHEALRASAGDPALQAWHAVMAVVWHVLSGFAAGLPAGYLSHLALDACTPRCIPLLA
jgi:uncharacterized membrane protein YeaQ/YmgE (transglycosylase-associated protein family)